MLDTELGETTLTDGVGNYDGENTFEETRRHKNTKTKHHRRRKKTKTNGVSALSIMVEYIFSRDGWPRIAAEEIIATFMCALVVFSTAGTRWLYIARLLITFVVVTAIPRAVGNVSLVAVADNPSIGTGVARIVVQTFAAGCAMLVCVTIGTVSSFDRTHQFSTWVTFFLEGIGMFVIVGCYGLSTRIVRWKASVSRVAIAKGLVADTEVNGVFCEAGSVCAAIRAAGLGASYAAMGLSFARVSSVMFDPVLSLVTHIVFGISDDAWAHYAGPLVGAAIGSIVCVAALPSSPQP